MDSPRANYGISRIDQPEKKNHGYYVRITHRGKTTQKFFPDKSLGGKAKALKMAQQFRDKLVARLPVYKREAAARKKRNVLKSGVTGVTHVVSRAKGRNDYAYWQAAWSDARGKRRTAKFSISRYGNDKALQMAKKALRDSKNSGSAPGKSIAHPAMAELRKAARARSPRARKA